MSQCECQGCEWGGWIAPLPSGVRLSISVCPIAISPLHPCPVPTGGGDFGVVDLQDSGGDPSGGMVLGTLGRSLYKGLVCGGGGFFVRMPPVIFFGSAGILVTGLVLILGALSWNCESYTVVEVPATWAWATGGL